MKIPVFGETVARRLNQIGSAPLPVGGSALQTEYNFMPLVAKIKSSHAEGETKDVDIVIGTKGSESTVVLTVKAYNRNAGSLSIGDLVILKNVNEGLEIEGGGGGGSGSTVCPCTCIDTGDIYVNGILTTSKWTVTYVKPQKRKQANGSIILPVGNYIVTWSTTLSKWILDIGSNLVAKYNDNSDATSATTMDGELTIEWPSLGSIPKVKLCITGTVPAPPIP